MSTQSFLSTNKNNVATIALVVIACISIVGLISINHTSSTTSKNTTPQSDQVAQARTSYEEKSSPTSTASTSSTESTDDLDKDQKSPTTTTPKETPEKNPETEPFSSMRLEADSVFVWDVNKKKTLYSKNAQKEQPLASLTKLMTALVATQNVTGQATTTLSNQHLDAYGEYGLKNNQTWRLDSLISFMLVESANDAARAVAAAGGQNTDEGYAKDFIESMNDTASELDLTDTYFFNPSGLDINEDLISGGYGTATEITKLFAYIQKHYADILRPTTQKNVSLATESGATYNANNTNTLVDQIPNTTGSKTGYTKLAGGNLIMGFNLNRPIIITVLGSTKEGRFTDMKTLYGETRKLLGAETGVNTN
jgi:D-alanyl-D-alanine carboxypeptidase